MNDLGVLKVAAADRAVRACVACVLQVSRFKQLMMGHPPSNFQKKERFDLIDGRRNTAAFLLLGQGEQGALLNKPYPLWSCDCGRACHY